MRVVPVVGIPVVVVAVRVQLVRIGIIVHLMMPVLPDKVKITLLHSEHFTGNQVGFPVAVVAVDEMMVMPVLLTNLPLAGKVVVVVVRLTLVLVRNKVGYIRVVVVVVLVGIVVRARGLKLVATVAPV